MKKLRVVKRGYTREHLSLEQLKGSTATGGDVAHLGCEAGLLDRCYGVAATYDGCASLSGDLGKGVGDRERSLSEGLVLEHSHWSVPYHGLALLQIVTEQDWR